jgi:hypothetical protein
MHEAARVGGIQGGGDLSANRKSADWLERPLAAQEGSQIRSLDEAHREVEAAVDVASVVDRYDIRVLEGHRNLRLARETVPEAIVERQLGRDELQRNGSLQPQVVGSVDDAHPAPADHLLDPIAEELGSNLDLGLGTHGFTRSSTRYGRAGARSRAFMAPALSWENPPGR